MNDRGRLIDAISHYIHHRFIWLLLGSYVVAAVFPDLGLWMKNVSFGQITLFKEKTKLVLPVLLLSFLLFNAGLGVQASQLRTLFRTPLTLIAGLFANLFVPVLFIFAVSQTMRLWYNPDEVQNILVGLALVAAMPIAGSSTAWSQNSNGNITLSLGLVLLSTFTSPITTSAVLHSVGLMATGSYAEALHKLAASGTTGFLAISVILPSLFGIAIHSILGKARIAVIKPDLKLTNSFVLLLLNYCNASLALPQAVDDLDWPFLLVTLLIVTGLCVLTFLAGWWLSRLLQTDASNRASLMFGLGMNNNGKGLVLASLALAGHPRVLLPIIFYNLVQHLVASVAVVVLDRRESNEIGIEIVTRN